MVCFSATFHHVGNPYAYISYGFLPRFVSFGMFSKCETEITRIFGEISDIGPTAWLHVGQNHLQVNGIQLDVVYTE